MTLRLYYTDANLRSFDARVLACEPDGDRFHVRLDRTAFYPTSGGQPFDTGRLGDARVVDVVDDEARGEVVHAVTTALGVGDSVRGEIDWDRRSDHRQQHTGQHILSAVLDGVFRAPTVSFHLGAETCTIDVAREVTSEEIAAAETQASQVVWRDLPVEVSLVPAEQAAAMPLRKPTGRTGDVRLVAIGDVDVSACGGTHVASTGSVGIIAVTGWEKFKGGTRISFVCGERALVSHRRLRDVTTALGRQLSVGIGDIGPAIDRLQQELRERQKDVATLQRDLAVYRSQEWRANAETMGPHRVVLRVDATSDAAALKTLAQAITSESGLVAVLVGGGTPAPLVVARAVDATVDASALVRAITTALGGRGGGRPELAQGGVSSTPDEIVAFVRQTLTS
ncbi:MAG: DHHA1 domain-containing protein [Acidobacteriota bacterium]